MMQVFDEMSFWGSISCLLLILLVGCMAELAQRILDRIVGHLLPKVVYPYGDSCLDHG